MEKLNRQQILSLPNGVTILRILVIPLILVLLFYMGRGYQLLTAAALSWSRSDRYLGRVSRKTPWDGDHAGEISRSPCG